MEGSKVDREYNLILDDVSELSFESRGVEFWTFANNGLYKVKTKSEFLQERDLEISFGLLTSEFIRQIYLPILTGILATVPHYGTAKIKVTDIEEVKRTGKQKYQRDSLIRFNEFIKDNVLKKFDVRKFYLEQTPFVANMQYLFLLAYSITMLDENNNVEKWIENAESEMKDEYKKAYSYSFFSSIDVLRFFSTSDRIKFMKVGGIVWYHNVFIENKGVQKDRKTEYRTFMNFVKRCIPFYTVVMNSNKIEESEFLYIKERGMKGNELYHRSEILEENKRISLKFMDVYLHSQKNKPNSAYDELELRDILLEQLEGILTELSENVLSVQKQREIHTTALFLENTPTNFDTDAVGSLDAMTLPQFKKFIKSNPKIEKYVDSIIEILKYEKVYGLTSNLSKNEYYSYFNKVSIRKVIDLLGKSFIINNYLGGEYSTTINIKRNNYSGEIDSKMLKQLRTTLQKNYKKEIEKKTELSSKNLLEVDWVGHELDNFMESLKNSLNIEGIICALKDNYDDVLTNRMREVFANDKEFDNVNYIREYMINKNIIASYGLNSEVLKHEMNYSDWVNLFSMMLRLEIYFDSHELFLDRLVSTLYIVGLSKEAKWTSYSEFYEEQNYSDTYYKNELGNLRNQNEFLSDKLEQLEGVLQSSGEITKASDKIGELQAIVREKNATQKKMEKELELLKEKLANVEKEKSALQQVMNIDNLESRADNEVEIVSDKQKLVNYLSNHKLVIIGGHINWSKKIIRDIKVPKENLTFVDIDKRPVLTDIALGCDAIIVVSTHCNHKVYEVIQASVQKHGGKICYLNSVTNIDLTYQDIVEKLNL